MKLTPNQAASLKTVLEITRERELNCNECLSQVGEFAEYVIQSESIPKALEAVEHHLSLCAECREEYESLLAAIKSLAEYEDGRGPSE